MSRAVLITAGATRNPIDAMRYISAWSSGRTGVALARALAPRHPVHLLASAEASLRAGDVCPTEGFGSTRDLQARMHAWIDANPAGVVVHAAAVGDYEADAEGGKIPSGQAELLVRLKPAPKILDGLRPRAPGLFLVSFKAAGPETTPEALVDICRAQLQRTGSDLVFGNVIGAIASTATLVDPHAHQRYASRDDAIAALAQAISGR
ncbi:MAG: hypothetical protein H6739_35570 [Alphaproteobacteria bacterium]|nr:hypothetical protein [Alphaproteobacteria bacterium]